MTRHHFTLLVPSQLFGKTDAWCRRAHIRELFLSADYVTPSFFPYTVYIRGFPIFFSAKVQQIEPSGSEIVQNTPAHTTHTEDLRKSVSAQRLHTRWNTLALSLTSSIQGGTSIRCWILRSYWTELRSQLKSNSLLECSLCSSSNREIQCGWIAFNWNLCSVFREGSYTPWVTQFVLVFWYARVHLQMAIPIPRWFISIIIWRWILRFMRIFKLKLTKKNQL